MNGIEELRLVVRNFSAGCSETFLARFTVDQLVQLHRMMLASGWDYAPDTWLPGQVEAALAGYAPQWDNRGEPIESSWQPSRSAVASTEELGKELDALADRVANLEKRLADVHATLVDRGMP